MLGRLAGQIDLDQQLESAARRRGASSSFATSRAIVHRMDRVETRAGLPRLVRLQVADQVPAEGRSAVRVHLLERFLDLVLAEVDLAGVGGGADVVGGEGLGDGDEADGGGVASGPAGGARDAIANAGQPGAERGGIDHTGYFLSCATSDLRRRCVRAVGRELQVRLELAACAGEIAFVDERHAELIVRLGVVGIGLRWPARTAFFASAILPPFHRMTPWLYSASALPPPPPAPPRARELGGLRAGLGRQVELPLAL